MKILNEIKIRQQQKLTMTPELLQSLNILKYTTLELNDLIKEEIVVNPALEVEGYEEESRSVSREEMFEQYADEYMGTSMSVTQKDVNLEDNNYEKYVSQSETLQDYLRLQLSLFVKEKRDNEIGEYIIESLDDNGYMTFSIDEIALKTGCTLDKAVEVLEVVQSFDPPGIAAVSVEDCLLRQLKGEDAIGFLAKEILVKCVDDVAANRLYVIARKLDVDLEKVQKAVDVIRHLNPRPGSVFESSKTIEYIVPDIFVTEDEEGNLIVKDNQRSLPTLAVSPYYRKIYDESGNKDEIKEYLLEKMESAAALIRNIEQRRNTILSVAKAIVEYQQDFFKKGEKNLKALTLKQIAEELDIHESTVSRTVNGKYLQCCRGMFELKFFFSSKVSEQSGGDVSSNSVKAYIKEIIAEENRNKPYSDQKILEMLSEKGFEVSRRTIAKYRDEMGIPSSSKRKRY